MKEQGLKQDIIEFEMLKGVTPERLQTMKDYGYRTRVYLPYGREWHLYLCNRLAEHPPNLYQAVTDAAKYKYAQWWQPPLAPAENPLLPTNQQARRSPPLHQQPHIDLNSDRCLTANSLALLHQSGIGDNEGFYERDGVLVLGIDRSWW
jgi:hypothetical protein